jgi:cyclic beta-1,2-glucan synthetase
MMTSSGDGENGVPDKSQPGLEGRAHRLAERQSASSGPGTAPTPVDRLSVLQATLREAYLAFLQESEERGTLSGVAEWLLDNYYIVQQAISQVRENMPPGYYRRLPKLDETPLAGYPRIYAVARELIRAARGHLDIDRLERFFRAYQEVRALTMGEIWALPTMLRLSILELLASAVVEQRESPPSGALRGIGANGGWRSSEALHAPPLPWVDAVSEEKADEAIVAAAVNSLRAISAQDWDAFFEAASLVEDTLRLDPLGVYAEMDFESRDRYRGVVEELARAVGLTEQEVAQEALKLAEEARQREGSKERAQHVGFYLVAEGRDQLEDAVQFRPRLPERVRRWIFDHAALTYLGSIALITALVLVGALAYALAAGAGAGTLVATVVLALLPASIVGVNVVNTVVTRTVAPRVLPRLDLSDGIPGEHRTMVVIPALLTSKEEVDFLLGQLERHYLGNGRAGHGQLGFALLTDFADAPQKHMPEDEALLEQAKEGIRRLNHKYGRGVASGSAGGGVVPLSSSLPEGGRGEGRRGPFYLFHRERLWNPNEDRWMGWERKRGKLVEFNRLIRGEKETSYVERLGNQGFLSRVKYVITLDADTDLPMDAGQELVGTLAHPLNRAAFADDGTGGGQRVVTGYTVLQPRTEVKPTAVTQTRFSRIFAGDAGLDLYTRAVSDVYQDLFGEGIYIGKGIYDVDAFERSLEGRVPENALLSHDLFEGIHGRAGLVTDVVVFEDYPPGYLSYAHRKHRWVRGDWQLLPWLLPRVPRAGDGTTRNTLSTLDRWKILDNLRRSLRAPVLFALLVCGWLFLPGSPVVWTLGALITSGMPLVTGAATEIARRLEGGGAGRTRLTPLEEIRKEAARWALSLVFLPYQSILMGDAIVTTLVRLTISRKRLLQWTTAAHTMRLFGRESRVGLVWRRMGGGPVLALIATAAMALLRPTALLVAAPFVVAWLLSPQVAGWISEPLEEATEELSDRERRRLRRLARRTWLYFERFVGPDEHWLPPDHFQEDPRGTVAHRTSPTNIGLMLLSSLSAYDLGYIGLMELSLRTSDAFDTMDELEKYRGHLMNWYDTRSLDPLAPRYVSTVDSGNLAACLVALRQGLEQLQRQRILRWQRWRGLCDTLGVLREIVDGAGREGELVEEAAALREQVDHIRRKMLSARGEPERWAPLLEELEDEVAVTLGRQLQTLLEAGSGVLSTPTLRDLRLWSERLRLHLRDLREEVERILPWAFLMSDSPAILFGEESKGLDPAIGEVWRGIQDSLPVDPRLDEVSGIVREARENLERLEHMLRGELASLDEEAQPGLARRLEDAVDWSEELDQALASARMNAGGMMIGLHDLAERADAYVEDMRFGFLYDEHRDVFYIGYQVDSEELDRNHYDLLASEARIASVLAISKGDVPQRHWLHLNRPLTAVAGFRVLLSWGGSMFEYLMPGLMMRNYRETLLCQANRAAVLRQIAYAEEKGVPWGVSESGYYRFDAQMNYQYRGFGVPGLGRKRGLGEDLVISPYASLLAVGVLPRDVLQNVERLDDEGMLGHYGFYEALDYTESRMPMGQTRAIVRSYMAHHQGMIMIALANYLNGQAQAGTGIVDRFHADPRIRSVEFLLQEQVPHQAPLEETPEETVGIERPQRERVELEPWSVPTDAPLPQVHVLSNGRYGTLITDAGAGYSSYSPGRSDEGETVALTRWRADTTLDCWGTWIYVQDRDRVGSGDPALWSATEQPTNVRPDEQQVRFYPHQAEFRRRHRDISLHTEITVAPEEDVEIRRVTLTNHGDGPRRLRVSSYGEVILAPQDQDRRHAAFNRMFIESEYVSDLNALLYARRPRSAEASKGDGERLHVAHMRVMSPELEATGTYESDRSRFVGRGHTVRAPAAFGRNGGASEWLSGTTGATLDPVMALGQDIEMAPHTTVQLAYLTLAAGSREEALALARRYRSWRRIDRAFDRAHAQSEVELRNLDLEVSEVRDIMRLLSALVYPHRALRADAGTLAENRLGQSGLWRFGISGDYPILLVRIAEDENVPLVRELLRAHAYWRDRQIKVDLVILNQKAAGYAQALGDQLSQVITQMDSEAWLNRRGGIFVVGVDQMDEASRVLLETAARAVLDADQGSLHDQLRDMLQRPSALPSLQPSGIPGGGPAQERAVMPAIARPDDLRFDNGFGGFSADGREYVIYLDSGAKAHDPSDGTPAPWINVIANPGFGFLVSETGLGYTWAVNSGENRLTPWGNDPVSNQPPEALYLRDEETGEIWSPTPLPAGEDAPYVIRHGAGYSVFEHNSHGLEQRLRLFAAPEAPVKVVHVRVENTWDRVRRITATFYAEWVLGINRDQAQQYVVSTYDPDTSALLAQNTYSPEFSGRFAFVAASEEPHGLTADRTEFLGRKGEMLHPAALDRVGLASRVEPGLDPCAAMQVHLDLEPGETKEIFFLLGQGEDRDAALELIGRYRDGEGVAAAWKETRARWDKLLGTVSVDTPDPAMDLLLNGWLLYQALSCRVWGRSALYQSSGAFGFRDQLQDVMSLLHAAPDLAREHILRAARHQFEEGDVLHWWHPPSGRGVRTRISDDLLWLPYVTAEYVETTGDEEILDEEVPFRRGEPLDADEEERYGHYDLTEEDASLYEHCLRALNKGSTSGRHGLPLIGAGDWNDGLNRVGIEGDGESVWLGWFLYATLSRFVSLCERRDDSDQGEALRRRARGLREALEESAWDGAWYIRATYDDGTPLGSRESDACKIASMAQSWAVLSGAGGEERVEQAMASVADWLVREDDQLPSGLILLFTPPFDETPRDPGYIKGYPPGIRENGGQYTHAALWAVWAYTELGQGDRAGKLFQLLNPIRHSETREKAQRYHVEPYVVAADVYSADQHLGKGGWTWYTGSSGWMYRLGIEAILGLRKEGATLRIEPCIPKDWSGYQMTYRYGETVYQIKVENPEGVNRGVKAVVLDGDELSDGSVPLQDDGDRHQVHVTMG